MEKLLTIHEVSEILGISTDAIRHYEKEGLIHPLRDDTNKYRYYNNTMLHTLMGISLYRQIGVSVSEIKELFQINNFNDIFPHISSLIEGTEQEIALLDTKLKKLRIIKVHLEQIENNLSTISIKSLEKRYVLSKSDSVVKSWEFTKAVMKNPYFSYGHISSIIDCNRLHEPDSFSFEFVIREPVMQILPEAAKNEIIDVHPACDCLYTIIKSTDKMETFPDLSFIYEYACKQNIKLSNIIQCFFVYTLINDGIAENYYEIYIEIL